MDDLQTFLQAVEAAMPAYGRSPVTGKPRTATSGPKYSDLAEKEIERRKKKPLPEGGRDVTAFEDAANAPSGPINAPEITNRMPIGGRDVTPFEAAANKPASPISAKEITNRMPIGGRDVTPFEQVANLSEDMTRNDTSFGLKNTPDQARNASIIEAALRKEYPTPLPEGGRDVTPFEAAANKPAPTGEGKGFLSEAGMHPDSGQVEAPKVSADKLNELFLKATGTTFEPKSKKDRAYMEKITSMLASKPETASLSPAKFALKLYGRK